MDLKPVTALIPQEYAGRTVATGEVFEVTPIEAASLKYRGRVLLGVRDTQTGPPARKRRAYKRRDLRAED